MADADSSNEQSTINRDTTKQDRSPSKELNIKEKMICAPARSRRVIARVKAVDSARREARSLARTQVKAADEATGRARLASDSARKPRSHMRHPEPTKNEIRAHYRTRDSENISRQGNTQSQNADTKTNLPLLEFDAPYTQEKACEQTECKHDSGPGSASISPEELSTMKAEPHKPMEVLHAREKVAEEEIQNQVNHTAHQNIHDYAAEYWYRVYEQDLWDEGLEAESTAKMKQYGDYLWSVWDSDEATMTIEMWLAKKQADETVQELDAMSTPSGEGDSSNGE